jgi:N-formylglutamate deformylase
MIMTVAGTFDNQDNGPAFTIQPAEGARSAIVVASPHSGTYLPARFLQQSRMCAADLLSTTDLYVDELWADAPSHGAPLIMAHYSRAFVDLNRGSGDLDPDMFDGPVPGMKKPVSLRSRAGFGLIPRITGDQRRIYADPIPTEDLAERIALVHQPYHKALESLIEETHCNSGAVLLIDGHSMPGHAPREVMRGHPLADIVIGDRHGESARSAISHFVQDHLKHQGLRVARNIPYAGGFATERHGHPRDQRYAIQLEVNRRLYLEADGVSRSGGFDHMRTVLSGLLASLIVHQSELILHCR